jgi:tRNA pseudouridine38-40 synthase
VPRRAFRIAYDGRPYRGFQRQPHGETVSDAILDALRALDICDEGAVPPGYAPAGRTDAGVSARAQTVALDAPGWLTPRALNAELPGDVWAWAQADAAEDFHATHDARRRAYRYHLCAPAADAERAREAVAALAGEHDFHNLTPDDSGTVRTLETAIQVGDGSQSSPANDSPSSVSPSSPFSTPSADGGYLVLAFEAGGFPRQLVRRCAELVRAVATGEAPLGTIERALGSDPLDGGEGVAPAPPYPLVLADVAYDLSFEHDARALTDARERFAALRAERRTLARVADDLSP